MQDEIVLGSGMKFPPQINPATGRFTVTTGGDNVKESVYLILMTQKRERFLRPEFGSNIVNYTFSDLNQTMLNMIAYELMNDLMNNEPRIKDVDIHFDPTAKEGCLMTYIDYTLAETDEQQSLVFPFYMDAIQEIY